MLDYLWAGMLILGILWGLLQGRGAELTQAVLDGGSAAIDLSLTMLGAMAIWTGIMEIAKEGGVLQQLNRLLRPVIHWLFPRLPKDHPATESISLNFAANMLGLGNAATPAALKAMKELRELEEERVRKKGYSVDKRGIIHGRGGPGAESERKEKTERDAGRTVAGKALNLGTVASDEMCMFLIINISSLQLIPINMIVYRSQYGSVNPAAITGPVLIETVISMVVGVVVCKVCQRRGVR